MGKIHYDKQDENACEEFDMPLNRTEDITPFFLTTRGDCTFVQKVRNMENIGVAVGIVIDNTVEDVSNVLMSDDGTGGGIRIPSMLIGSKDGKKLIEWLSNASEDDLAQLVIMCEFVMPYAKDDIVDYDFWYTSSSNRALDFLEDFAQFDNTLAP